MRRKERANVGLLIGVALGFMLLGVAIALAVTKLLAR